MGTMMCDLLSCEDHLDVTFVLEDGELKSNKSTMFRNNNFKESNGIVEFPCKKNVLENVLMYLCGGKLDCSEMSLEQKMELFNIFRIVLVEDSIFYTAIRDKGFGNVESLVSAAKTLETTLLNIYY